MNTSSKTKSIAPRNTSAQAATAGSDVEVLYQKMGNRWFAFSVVNGDVFTGSITQEEIDMLERREATGVKTFGVAGNT